MKLQRATTAISVLDHKTLVHPTHGIPVKINLGILRGCIQPLFVCIFASPGGYKYLVGKTK
jgi:hypothetical protein